jgi:hypothetical protein
VQDRPWSEDREQGPFRQVFPQTSDAPARRPEKIAKGQSVDTFKTNMLPRQISTPGWRLGTNEARIR